MNHVLRALLGCAVAAILSLSQKAEACGCFAPPSTVEPIVQAGERILFSVKDGKVTAHIQIQYSGEAKDFGWLLPLPSVPTLKLGSDELFTRLGTATAPQYVTTQTLGQPCAQPAGGFALGCAAPRSVLFSEPTNGGIQDAGTSTPLVTASSIGPYDFAVLKADDKTAMFQWLSDNRFFVPTGTDDAVGPYIRPGAYFLALKLKAGARSGDVTPVVVEYPSQLPMIPLILTSVGATPNMGVQVYLLGEGRGIPRNFHHVVLNDARLDWLNGATNYASLVTAAVAEAPQKHAFITEYAGSSEVMVDQLAPPGRFGTEQELAATTTPQDFVAKLYAKRFGFDATGQPRALPSPVVRLLLTDIPYPSGLAARGINGSDFINNIDYYLGTYRSQNPEVFVGYMTNFDAPSLAQQIFEQYVAPMREANALFAQHPKLTRLITTLSPEDMTEDPVFSFNPALPDVIPVHAGKIVMNCGDSDVETAQGFKIQNVSSSLQGLQDLPAALRIETLSEEGQAIVVTDNTDAITTELRPAVTANMNTNPKTGCSTVDPMTLGFGAALILMRMRSKRRAARS